jgi:hypothetical protein
MTDEQILQANFESLGLPPEAVRWLLDMWQAIQTFDDVVDSDQVSPDDASRALWSSLCGLQMNAFHAANAGMLVPVVALQILKWHGANAFESRGRPDARSFVWRAGFYDLILWVIALALGPDSARDKAAQVMDMYGEDFAEYIKEFGNA